MTRPPLFLRVLAASALLAGCAVGPDFQPPATEAPADFATWHGGAPELVADLPRQGTAAPIDWQSFGDPVLTRLQARALAANADLQTAALRFAQSRAQGTAVRAQG